MSTGKEGKPTFQLTYPQNDGITYYILLSTAPHPQAKFLVFILRHPQIRVEIWRVTVATATQTTSFLLSFF
jgi:hypothetical protein